MSSKFGCIDCIIFISTSQDRYYSSSLLIKNSTDVIILELCQWNRQVCRGTCLFSLENIQHFDDSLPSPPFPGMRWLTRTGNSLEEGRMRPGGGGVDQIGQLLYCLFENTENKLKRGWVCQFFLKNTMLPKLILPNFEPDWAVVVAQSDGRAIASPHQMTQVRIQPSIMNISLHSTVEKTKRKRGLGWHIK